MATTFLISEENTFAAVIVRNDDSSLLSKLGHDHVVRAARFQTEVHLDLEDLQSLELGLAFPVEALVVDDQRDRQRVGLSGKISEKDRRATAENMRAKGQLHSGKFPQILFHVQGAEPGEEKTHWKLKAALTVAGTTHHFHFPVEIKAKAEGFLLSGEIAITHQDLGLRPYRAPLGALRNKEELAFVVEVTI